MTSFPLPGANWTYTHGLKLVATTGPNGYVLQNGTANILTWTAPNDGQLHRFMVFSTLDVFSAETGGAIGINYTVPGGGAQSHTFYAAGLAPAVPTSPAFPGLAPAISPGTTVTLTQSSALTAGAATLWAEIWAA